MKNEIKLFQDKKIRSVWVEESEEWVFSVVDVIGALTDQPDRRRAGKYWSVLKTRLKSEGSELTTNCSQLKMIADDGKMRMTDVAGTKQLLRIIQSIPSPKAEPFKLWLAETGKQRLDEIADPELAVERMKETYRRKGYSEKWINQRMKSIDVRNELTEEWDRVGVKGSEYAVLTDEITRAWSGMTTRQFKNYKGLTKEGLRDNMTNMELILNMVDADPAVIKNCPNVIKRISKVREYRLQSPKAATRKKAETPMLFDEVRECTTDYVAIPKVSSERRRYIPMEYLSAAIIPGDKLFMIQGSTLYHFGVLTSNVHMAWMRAVVGRLKSDYSYSNTIVYNNFPWPSPTDSQKTKIETTAQGILDARAKYPDASLADLYDELTMPIELRKAHQANDRAVMEAYGFSLKMTEQECVAELMKMYQKLVDENTN